VQRILLTSALLLLTACASADENQSVEAWLADGIYPDVIEHPMPEDLSQFKQPESLVADLKAIQEGSLEERIEALADKSRRDQVFVEGGTFLMGDFGRLQSEEGLPWDGNSNSSPLHEVTLDSYSISKYKVTLAEFDLYAEANDVTSVQTEKRYNRVLGSRKPWRAPDKPAGTTWSQARTYCTWLGEITGHSFSLPTEAQWEYAARDRGRFIVYPTDNGKLEWNKNAPSWDMEGAINSGNTGRPYPIALFPPNPLGLYDLAENSLDWVQDWYAEDWYDHSARARNPSGPESGDERVQRGRSAGFGRTTMTVLRSHGKPGMERRKSGKPVSTIDNGFRCAVQSPERVSPH